MNIKVIMVGPPILYHLLQAYEEDFGKLFKVKRTSTPKSFAASSRTDNMPDSSANSAARKGCLTSEPMQRLRSSDKGLVSPIATIDCRCASAV